MTKQNRRSAPTAAAIPHKEPPPAGRFRCSADSNGHLDDRERLVRIVEATPWLIRALHAVRAAGIPHACAGAGAIRGTVWGHLHGYTDPSPVADVDVAYFDSSDLSRESETGHRRRLCALEPGLVWDVVNQAAVHVWYEGTFGRRIAPFESVEDGVGSWPETATAVAVWLDASGRVEVVAPCGLADLFACVVRRNPRFESAPQFRARVDAKRYQERWPSVHVVWE
jgi:hypothetical protein